MNSPYFKTKIEKTRMNRKRNEACPQFVFLNPNQTVELKPLKLALAFKITSMERLTSSVVKNRYQRYPGRMQEIVIVACKNQKAERIIL